MDDKAMYEQLSKTLDEAIAEYENLVKGELVAVDTQISPSGADGDPVSPSGAATMGGDEGGGFEKAFPDDLKDDAEAKGAEDESDEDDKDEDSKDAKGDEDEAEEGDEKDEDDDEEGMEKFSKNFYKMLDRLGMSGDVNKSEDEGEVITKSEDEIEAEIEAPAVDTLSKSEFETKFAALTGEVTSLKSTIETLAKSLERLAKAPVGPRKSASGVSPVLRKSEAEAEAPAKLNKSATLDKLMDLQKSGDKRVTSNLIIKYEMTGNDDLVKGLV
jgi:hypothetical protein